MYALVPPARWLLGGLLLAGAVLAPRSAAAQCQEVRGTVQSRGTPKAADGTISGGLRGRVQTRRTDAKLGANLVLRYTALHTIVSAPGDTLVLLDVGTLTPVNKRLASMAQTLTPQRGTGAYRGLRGRLQARGEVAAGGQIVSRYTGTLCRPTRETR